MKNTTTFTASKNIISLLRKQRLTLSLAESCTGGLLSSLLTQHAGVSDVYLGAVVSYSNQSKTKFLGVRTQALKKFGAVSLPVAAKMSIGARKSFRSDIAIAITGIAGPTGGT
ncbi:MAG: CinA family protein, partial [Bdellovibrionales bacterium]|nr:CinA family protein [Bdellovibrionales bacterium]